MRARCACTSACHRPLGAAASQCTRVWPVDAVYGELLEKGLAYNLCRLARFRRAALAQTKRYGEPLCPSGKHA